MSTAEDRGAPADPSTFPDVIATVNGTELQKSELMARVQGITAQSRGAIDTTTISFYHDVLDEMIGAELLYQASQKRDLTVEDDQIDGQLQLLKNRFPGPTEFEQALSAEGLTLEALREQIERDLSIQNLIKTDIASRVSVTDEEMRAFYDENAAEMREPDQLRLSHILKRVAPDATPEQKEATRIMLQNVLEQARSGENFAKLAREHSEDPGSAQNGGELVVSRGQTVPPFEQAAFALEPEGISEVVETRFGFHIIKLSEKIEGRQLPYEEVQPRIQQHLRQQSVQTEIESTVEALRNEADVELFIDGGH